MNRNKTLLDDDMGFVYIKESMGSDISSANNVDCYNKNGIFYVTFDTNLQSFDVLNRNKRMYQGSNIWECIQQEKIQSLLAHNGWFGEFNHPTQFNKNAELTPERIRDVPPEFRAFKIMSPHITGNLLQGKIQSAQNDIGIGFGKEILAGWIPQFSCRAIASMKLINGKPYVIVRRLITYDAVWYPSHKEAEAISAPKAISKKIQMFSESAKDTIKDYVDDVMIPLKEILEHVGTHDVNTQLIMESFDLSMDNLVGIDETRTHAIIKDNDNMIYANINPHTKKEVDNFFCSFDL